VYEALIWLLVIEALGLIALPLTYTLFGRLPDRGLALSKLLALLLAAYVLWVLGLTHVVPNSIYTIIAILAVIALFSFLILRRRGREIATFLRRERIPLLTGEMVFLGLYALWLVVVFNAPAINHTEKPMDFAFLNAIVNSTYFPPEDPWLAGHHISYYYFGHFMMATLTTLTAIPSSVSYNLSVALIPALVGAAAFSLVYNLVRISGGSLRVAVLFALGAPVLLLLIGNLEGVMEFVHARGWGSQGFWEWVSIKGLGGEQTGEAGFFPNDYLWWWRGTRVIDTVVDGVSKDYTITEFPFFSFLLGDLHAHVSSLPFMLFNLALGLNLFVSKERLGLGWLRGHPWEALAIALSMGAMAFINIWDFPVFAAFLVAIVLAKGYGDWGGQIQGALRPSLMVLAPILVVAVLLYIPFYVDLSSQASGIAPLRDVSTKPLFFFLIWGLFMVLSGSFLVRQLWGLPGLTERNPGPLSTVLVIALLPFLLWAGIVLLISPFDGGVAHGIATVVARLGKLLPGLVVVAVALYAMLVRVKQGGEMATPFVLLPLALAFYLLIGAELFYMVDLFGNRMNTVFKLYYQAWLLLAIVSAYSLYYLWSRPMPSPTRTAERLGPRARAPLNILVRSLGCGGMAMVAILFLASLYYPVGAGLNRTDQGGGGTFDGLAYLQDRDRDEYEAIEWLRDEAPWGRIVEAVGADADNRDADYDPKYGRVSGSTGLPTVLGWQGHEHQWRGSRRPFDGRREDVADIYGGEDPERVLNLLDAYDIRYVYVGPRERAKYGDTRLHQFDFLQPVFERADVVIYERTRDVEQSVANGDDEGAG